MEDFEFGETGMVRTILSEDEVAELAAELVTVQDDDEFEEWLGSLFRKVRKKVGKFARSTVGKKLIGALKGVAKKALPLVGRAAGTYFGGPLGGQLGAKLGGVISSRLEEESEEAVMEAAEQFVRFAAEATAVAAKAPVNAPAKTVTRAAIVRAQRRFPLPRVGGMRRRSGRWVRRGHRIIVLGV
jgi:hypothetical protein